MTTTTMEVPALHVGAGTYADGVTVFPVWTDAPGANGLATGPAVRVQVGERAGSPTVGELVLRAEGERPVLLLEGELLEGGMQHRTLVHDLLLMDPMFGHVVPVACVEHGRWNGGDGHARRGRRAAVGVQARLRTGEGRRQQAVWEQVAGYRELGHSPTDSLLDHLDREAGGEHPPPGGRDRAPPARNSAGGQGPRAERG
ncbi:MAG: ARPP-1 family domain-containing protein, partial [Sporichthyaceae bacterium]